MTFQQQTPEQLIIQALREDIGDGDHTSNATIPEHVIGYAHLLVKEPCIIAGIEVARKVFAIVNPDIIYNPKVADGDFCRSGTVAFEVQGPARSILAAERLVLNIMQRMSGIATKTQQFAQLIRPYKAKVLDTRKTTPNFRLFEKMAVKIGGGDNHRFGLYDMILVKDNHVDYAGGITAALNNTREYLTQLGRSLPVEVEVRSFAELDEALAHPLVHRVLLDNFSPAATCEAVKRIAGRVQVESSGNITEDTIQQYAACGVDFISSGALTHSVQSIDLSLKAFTPQ